MRRIAENKKIIKKIVRFFVRVELFRNFGAQYLCHSALSCKEGRRDKAVGSGRQNNLLEINEALCSFLASWKRRKLSSLQKAPGYLSKQELWMAIRRDVTASRDSVELFYSSFAVRVHPTYLSLKMGHAVPRFLCAQQSKLYTLLYMRIFAVEIYTLLI